MATKESNTCSACTFETINGKSIQLWTKKSADEENSDDMNMYEATTVEISEAVIMKPSTILRVAPMGMQDWQSTHFCTDLGVSTGQSRGNMVIQLEAQARECLAIALSPTPDFKFGCTYVCHFGASANLCTVIRRRLNHEEHVDASFPSTVCNRNEWQSYWVVIQGGVLKCGVGDVIGKNVVCELDDSLYNQLRSGLDAVKFVGIGNSTVDRHSPQSLKVRNVCVFAAPVEMKVRQFPAAAFISLSESANNEDDKMMAELMKEYAQEVSKARARAAKFGIAFKEPAPDAFMSWSEAKRLRSNTGSGFVTGIDITTEEERQKQQARRERFGLTNTKKKRNLRDDEDNGDEDGEIDDDGSDDIDAAENDDDDDDDDGYKEDDLVVSVDVSQAWDNEKMLRRHRADPYVPADAVGEDGNDMTEEPSTTDAVSGGEDTGNDDAAIENFSSDEVLEDENGDDTEGGGDDAEMDVYAVEATPVPEKIHLQCLDWSAFKQIRSPDIMCHFAAYGPSYVEWLGDLSCNVVFADCHSAKRALNALSQEIPSPPPLEKLERGCLDLGKMGWRLCITSVRKVSNDEFGRRGTRSRYLVREATTNDVLESRPTSWPKPPPGFTTRRVLGPNSDFPKRRRKKGGRNIHSRNNNVRGRKRAKRARRHQARESSGNAEPDLDSALSCPR
uniref:Farnesoic acid O-methyl transferase domain-containing protein n=2 Tax=Leptocylindrus danicus TaxID=163516 RepID=A0A7S2L9J9_9STRA|mmetsp:Transcript_33518/g.48526  ORF Transcript_33518/g.48526 Transcript_33518/m.48526 type:complete len:674 (+) Transcript_33518:33-2054(+)